MSKTMCKAISIVKTVIYLFTVFGGVQLVQRKGSAYVGHVQRKKHFLSLGRQI